MNLSELPGIPPDYCKLAEAAGRGSHVGRVLARARLLAGRPTVASESWTRFLSAVPRAPAVDMIARPGRVTVVGVVGTAPLGGPLYYLLKALTVLRLARLVREVGVEAVPVVLVAPAGGDTGGAELHHLNSTGGLVEVPAGSGLRSTPERLAGIRRDLGVGDEDETMELLSECFLRDDTPGSATAAFYASLFAGWDCAVVSIAQPLTVWASQIPETAALVIGPEDFDGADGRGDIIITDPDVPVWWPRLSATLVDSRARKTLDRYGIGLADTYAGAGAILDRLGYEGLARAAARQFSSIQEQLSRGVSALEKSFPDDRKLLDAIASTSQSITYQLDRLRERFEPAAAQRLDSARRQLDRLCNLVAPAGRAQERTLAAFYFLARFSRGMIERLYSQLDPTRFEHQVVNLE